MSDLFAPLFELGSLYTPPYSQVLFEGLGYTLLGLSFIFIPLFIMFLFYYAWNPVFGRWYHWLLMVGVASLLTGLVALGIIGEELAQFYGDPDYTEVEFYSTIISLLIGIYALVTATIWSFIIRFKSTNNNNNPIATNFL
jgi:hypothetical protein